jgi:hypothetical protein
MSSRLREACHHPKDKKQNPDFLYIIRNASPLIYFSLIFILLGRGKDSSRTVSIGRKSYMSIEELRQ